MDPIGQSTSALIDSTYALDSNPDLPNPERGVSYWVGNTASDPHTVKNHFLWLGTSCNASLSWMGRANMGTSAVLKTWADTAVGLRDLGQKVIFRPRYDSQGAGEGKPNACGMVEGASYSQMQNHVQAIASMLADPEIKPIVAFVEMGYLGSWGEWNTGNTNCGLDVTVCRQFAPVLLAPSAVNDRIHFAKYVIDTYRAAGMTRTVGLRRPEFYKDAEFNLGVASTKMGFYNDCFMANAGDMGTFSWLESDYTNYADIYPNSVLADEAAAKSYMQGKAGDGSQGGESCPDNNNETWRTSPSSVPTRLDADSYHYLHGGYAEGFRPAMVSAGQWDTIKGRLGYRYQVTQVNYPTTAAPGASVTVSVTITNSGFAKIPYDRTAYIALYGPANYVVGASNPKTGTYTQIVPTAQTNQTARSWNKGPAAVFTQTFPAPSLAGTYTVHLYIPDADCVNNTFCSDTIKAKYAVRLATLRGGSNVFNTTTGTNNLGVTLAVSGGSCTPNCSGKVCGTDGCGGSCGTCTSPATCDGTGQCVGGGVSCVGGGNLVQNCDFAGGTASWSCGVSGTAVAICSVASGVHQTAITSPGAFNYSVQPNQGNLSLTSGTTYTVSFDARASVANRPIATSVTMNHGAFSSYSGVQNFTLSTTMATKTFNFLMSQPSDTNAKIEFDLGANGNNTVYVDNVVVKAAGGGTGTHACTSATDCQTHLTKNGLPAWNSSWGNLTWASGICSMYDWTEATAYYGTYPGQCSTNQPPGSTCVSNNGFAEKEYTWTQCKD